MSTQVAYIDTVKTYEWIHIEWRGMGMKIGFIGLGNMATAMIKGILKEELVKPEEIIGSAPTAKTREKIKSSTGISVTADNRQTAREADVLILAIKPQIAHPVIREIREAIRDKTLIISILAGRTLSWLEDEFGQGRHIIRAMPNTPALVGEGMSAIVPGETVSEEELQTALRIFSSFGKAEVIPEARMDAVIAVSGSSPAYVFLLIEAMADAAVLEGMPRKQAYSFAAQAVLGSARMLLETGMHPGELKDMVCSPAGTTIEAVRVLEEKGFRSSIIEAMHACAEKNRRM